MIIKKQIFFHVTNDLNWQSGRSYFIGSDKATRYAELMQESFVSLGSDGTNIPMSMIAEGMDLYLNHQKKLEELEKNYHFDAARTFRELAPMINAQLTLIRELIFEEVRKEYFSNCISRYNAIQVIPCQRESLSYWLPLLKKPKAKVYKLALTGKIHRANCNLLTTDINTPKQMQENAYQYWLGNNEENAIDDECLFEGVAKVLEVINTDKIIK